MINKQIGSVQEAVSEIFEGATVMIGGFGEAEIFSFHATKFVNSFEGGAVATNDEPDNALPEMLNIRERYPNYDDGPRPEQPDTSSGDAPLITRLAEATSAPRFSRR